MNEINSKSFNINIDKPTIADLEVYFQKHSASLDALRQSMQKATEKIIDLKGNETATSLKELLDKDIQNVSDSISNLEDNMNTSFRDGVITEAECISIKNSLSRLDTEKADIDKNYENLYNNVNLSGVAKTNLNSTYTAYVSIHTELVNYVNGVMVDNTATTEEVTEVKNKLNRYNVALSNYKVAQNVAVNSIAEAVSNNNLAEYKTLVSKDINDINKKINDMTTDIGSVVIDGVIDEAEAMILANNITELNKEKVDIDARYNNVYNNPNLKGTAKSNLKTRYDNFCLSHNSLIETINTVIEDNVATESEKVDLQTALDDYSSNLSLLSVSFDEAFKSISEAIANSVSEELRKELQGNINDVAESVQNLNTYIDGAFKDSVLTDTEKESIRTYLKTLATEKADIDNQYKTLYNNSDLLGTAKSNLKTSYDNYVTKYNALIYTINTILTYTEITSANKTELDNAFREHDSALATYSQRVNEAINSIAEKKKEDAKSYTNAQFNVLEDRIELRVTSKEMEEYVGTVSDGLQNQIDGKIETYYQTTDPSVNWTTSELKTQHKGDIWYDSLNNITYRWGGIAWVKITDADAEAAKALATSKAKVFTSTPTTPYKVGDLWVQGSGGDIMKCTYNRSSGNYVSSDWAKASKYTDDTVANQVANNLNNNYYTIKETDSAISVTKQGILSEVSSKYTTTDDLGNTLSEYATKSEMKQTGEDITAKFTEEHNNGYEQGIVAMNKNGITVTHTNVNSVTKMMAEGFYIEDSNGETIASLSSKEQWSELKADKVFANNIENVYEGDANLYVDHSKTVVGSGSVNSPFSCFYELRDYLEKAPIINKDLTINVVSTGTISDVLYLRGLKGRGAITININKEATYVDQSSSNSFIYLYDVQNVVTIKGGRTGYATSDGALISNYKYGVFANNCRYVRVEYIAINTKSSVGDQWGVIFNATNGMTYRVDFCDSPNAIYADRSSQVYDSDSCGNGTIAFYSTRGSSIMFGSSEDNGYRPSGSLIKGGGNIVDLGNRSVRTSFRTAPAVPSTVNQYKDFSFSDYGYYSELYGTWNSIGYKTVYQGSWQGYGINRGVFTLPNSDISSYLSGATVLDGNQITLQRENAGGYSASQTIYLWGTTQTSASGSAPPLTKSYGALGMLAWGERKTFTLPKAFVSDLKAGTIKSVMFYTGNGSNYIKFSPVCTLRLKVNK